MNCQDFQDWLQADLDGDSGPCSAALGNHLAACAACQRLHSAGQGLRRGLCLLAPPPVPAGLLDRVVDAVLTDRRHRQRQRFRVAGALALAVSVLVVVLADRLSAIGDRLSARSEGPDATLLTESRSPGPSIHDTVAEARSAVAELTARTVDQAVDRTRMLLPTVDDSLLSPMELRSPLEPPSLSGAGQGVSASLEPLADSARRAFALFRRDLPPVSPNTKPEL